jgi:hypothetical protein
MPTPESYHTYRNLPPLAGVATHAEAARPGYGIEAAVSRLKRFHYAFRRLHEILTARITAEPIYELKIGFSHHAYLCAEHVEAIRKRVSEMREPPLGLEAIPHPALEVFFDEILAAAGTIELLQGVYQKALPWLKSELETYRRETNPLADAPSVRLIRFALLEIDDLLKWGQASLDVLITDQTRLMGFWLDQLDECLAAFANDTAVPPRIFSQQPYRYDPVPKRDERFQDLYNQGVNAEAFLYDPQMPAQAKSLMMLFKRLREIDVPEMMASILTQTKDKPWGYYLDMTRQLWDEARHAMMGEVGFVALGVDWTKARITHNWSLRLNTECTPMERHAVLFFIEQGLMTRTGKRYEWEVGSESGIPLMATIQDFDWADEVLHAQIGREWYIVDFPNLKAALEYGDQCWSRILSNWQAVKDQGLTRHDNWWPEIYRQACATWGIAPDEKVLNYSTTYEGKRADLKTIGVGGSA